MQTSLAMKRRSVNAHLKSSMGLMLTPANSSAGPLKSDYTMPWDLALWRDPASDAAHLVATWAGGDPSQPFRQILSFPVAEMLTDNRAQAVPMNWKLLCHFVIDRLP